MLRSLVRFQPAPPDEPREPTPARRMRAIRRALAALGVAAVVAGVLRLRGTGGVPPRPAGWGGAAVPAPPPSRGGPGGGRGAWPRGAAGGAAAGAPGAGAGAGGPACARVRRRALGACALDWRDGTWVRRPGGSGRELAGFPDPGGGQDCYRASLPDALVLVPAFAGV